MWKANGSAHSKFAFQHSKYFLSLLLVGYSSSIARQLLCESNMAVSESVTFYPHHDGG
jgi:hypothetical protein